MIASNVIVVSAPPTNHHHFVYAWGNHLGCLGTLAEVVFVFVFVFVFVLVFFVFAFVFPTCPVIFLDVSLNVSNVDGEAAYKIVRMDRVPDL